MPITLALGRDERAAGLPGFTAASNWMRLVSTRLPSAVWYSRPSPEITPAETEGPMPKGKPTATTGSPGRKPAVERRWRHRDRRDGLCLQHGEVMLRLHADHHGVGLQAVVKEHLDAFRALHHVQIGQDDAGVDDHDARAALRLALGGHVGVRRVKGPAHVHEGRQDRLVSVGYRRGRLLRLQCLLHQELDVGRSQAFVVRITMP